LLFYNSLSTKPHLDEKPQALATEQISAVQSGALAHIPLTPGLLMHKISKPRPFSGFEYLCGNETIFVSEK